jgi:hypothetical protein
VIPLVVHHNQRPWSGPTDVIDLIDLDPDSTAAAREFLPRFRFLLDDLARIDLQALRERPLTADARLTLLLLKTAPGNSRVGDDLKAWVDDIQSILARPDGIDTLITLLTYIGYVSETPTDELHKLFTQLGPDAEEAYVTTAEMLRAEGEAPVARAPVACVESYLSQRSRGAATHGVIVNAEVEHPGEPLGSPRGHHGRVAVPSGIVQLGVA